MVRCGKSVVELEGEGVSKIRHVPRNFVVVVVFGGVITVVALDILLDMYS